MFKMYYYYQEKQKNIFVYDEDMIIIFLFVFSIEYLLCRRTAINNAQSVYNGKRINQLLLYISRIWISYETGNQTTSWHAKYKKNMSLYKIPEAKQYSSFTMAIYVYFSHHHKNSPKGEETFMKNWCS